MFKLFGVDDDDDTNEVQVQQRERYKGNSSYKTRFDEEEDEYQKDNQENEGYHEDENVGQIALDVLENRQSIYILVPVAGVELKDIDITVHETTLTISGVRNKPREFYENEMQIKNQECFWGRFLRNVILPENMDFSQVRAVMEHNLLVIHIPKIRFDSQNIKINRIES
ncbi:Hsp20/alpha crystallin family protein [Candidatus Gracilibacteria bacterium]|nr:Hsp20/alpha crystallin family protein [Candidatus Gracilibacteria bacterium]